MGAPPNAWLRGHTGGVGLGSGVALGLSAGVASLVLGTQPRTWQVCIGGQVLGRVNLPGGQ